MIGFFISRTRREPRRLPPFPCGVPLIRKLRRFMSSMAPPPPPPPPPFLPLSSFPRNFSVLFTHVCRYISILLCVWANIFVRLKVLREVRTRDGNERIISSDSTYSLNSLFDCFARRFSFPRSCFVEMMKLK